MERRFALRHARASRTTVRIAMTDDELQIEVTDDGSAVSRRTDPARGHGLRGMIERARTLGGNVSAGPMDGSGWRVRATLPLRQE